MNFNKTYRIVVAAVALFAAGVYLYGCGSSTEPPSGPLGVTNLHAVISFDSSAVLGWTVPSSSDRPAPSSYDLRYSTTAMHGADDWNAAIRASLALEPGEPGSDQTVQVEGLQPNTDYYMALQVIGANGEPSKVSNQIRVRTADTLGPLPFNALDLDGNSHSSSEWLGNRLTLINFWGAWCGWCKREMPHLIETHNAFVDSGVVIIGFNYGDSPERARQYADSMDLPWLNVMISGQISQAYGVTGYPTTILIDSTGREIGRLIGYHNFDAFSAAINYVLHGESTEPINSASALVEQR